MVKKKIVNLLIIIVVLSSLLVFNPVLGSHENPDEIDEDIGPLISTLERTKEDIESSLDESLEVNYTIDEEVFSDSYELKYLNRSRELAEIVEEEFSSPDSVLGEIRGEIGSSEHLEAHFVPLLYISENLTGYVERHEYLISNLSVAVELVQEDEDPGDYVANSMDHLSRMKTVLSFMERNIGELDSEAFDLDGLENLIEENFELLGEYEGYIEDLKEEARPTNLSIFGPSRGHPGSEVVIHGYFLDEGRRVSNISISLFKDGEKVDSNSTSDGYYEFLYKIDWSQDLGEVVFSTEVEGISSRNLSVDVIRYPSEIELETEKDAYYNESVKVSGRFVTEAEVDLSRVELEATLSRKVNLFVNGSFELEYDSREFRWGTNEIVIEYSGNRTISESSENITIEVSIPTEIQFFEYSKELEEGAVDEFYLEGRLINVSSGQGLEGQNLTVFLDGEPVGRIKTGEDGDFSFSLEEHDLEVGRHTLSVSFEGPERYRNVDSEDIVIEVKERTLFFRSSILFLAMILFLLSVIFVRFYYVRKEEKEERSGVDEFDPAISRETSIPAATSREEVPNAYRELLETLRDSGMISISRGKTHREIAEEMNSHPRFQQMGEDIKRVTGMFEKSLFTERSIRSEELKNFNSSLSRLSKEWST